MARAKDHLPATGPELYEQDFALWIEEQVARLRNGDLAALDIVNLIDEVRDLGISQKLALESNLVVVLKHLLKHEHQPDRRSGSWTSSIREHRRRISRSLTVSPSLRPYAAAVIAEAYAEARLQAADETRFPLERFPEDSPYTIEQVLDPDFLPG